MIYICTHTSTYGIPSVPVLVINPEVVEYPVRKGKLMYVI